jgi:peptidoglycan hydrolase-like protein with peptidoglycan-binding domain
MLAAIGPTSYFDLTTQNALVEYQKSVGIAPASGYFGSKTRAAILGGTTGIPVSRATTPAPAVGVSPSTPSNNPPFTEDLSYGMTDPQVSTLQRFLAKNPLIYPQGLVTGYYGLGTQQAIQTFQITYSIAIPSADYGMVDAMTRVELNKLYLAGEAP